VESSVLKAITAVTKDGEWGKGEPFDSCVQMAVIRGTDFEDARSGLIDRIPSRYIPAHIAARKQLQPFDVLIETAGGSKDRPTGRTLLVKPGLISKSALPLTCASFARFVRMDYRKADPAYVFWVLQYLYKAGVIRQYHTQHTGVARFQFTTFAERESLPLPPRSTQEHIAATLSAYDDLIENNTRRIKILEEMARMLYRGWFVNFRFPGHEKVRTVDSEWGPIPAGWSVRTLKDVTSFISRGISPTYDDAADLLGHQSEVYSRSPLKFAASATAVETHSLREGPAERRHPRQFNRRRNPWTRGPSSARSLEYHCGQPRDDSSSTSPSRLSWRSRFPSGADI
jgi:type I restriction enzyme, S subunit